MKRVLSILLVLVVSFNFLGAGFVYNIWLYSIKSSVKEQLKGQYEEEPTIIKLSKDAEYPSLKWHESEEFEYRGQMYDVIKKEDHGNTTWYYCYWDKAETKLLNHLAEYVSGYLQQHPREQKNRTLLSTYLDKLFLLSNFELALPGAAAVAIADIGNLDISSIFLDVDLPPPRLRKYLSIH
ncbi:MAG: hypothetical protein U5J63_02010 [Fodinibius sp.]|nr:hypothetical protein [Fodinibius sp.]